MEGKLKIQNWMIIQAKYQCHIDPWMILSEIEACMGTVHMWEGHAKHTCNFAIHLISHYSCINQCLSIISVWLTGDI